MLISARYGPHMSLHLLLLSEQVVAYFYVRFLLQFLVQPLLYVIVPDIFRVVGSFLSSFEVSDELYHKAVEFMKVDVCQYWGNDSPLWRTAVGAMVLPIFAIPQKSP